MDTEVMEAYLRQEFSSLYSGNKLRISTENINKFQAAYQPHNRCKNRYRDILPNESSRVKLSPLSEGDGDYINANYIDQQHDNNTPYNQHKGYILTQAPLTNTFDDFWRMVWLEKIPIIICLTKMSEGGVQKGTKYWPDDGQVSAFGKISVLHRMTMSYHNITVRMFSIWLDADTAHARDVIHLQYEDWPDHGTPTQTKTIRSLVHLHSMLVERGWGGGGRPLIHCSAGVGRAGTYCAIHQIITRIEHNFTTATTNTATTTPFIDLTGHVKDTVNRLRLQREGTVQTPEQYIFIHRAIHDMLASRISFRRSYEGHHHHYSSLSSDPSLSSSAPSESSLPSSSSALLTVGSSRISRDMSQSVHYFLDILAERTTKCVSNTDTLNHDLVLTADVQL